jgi:poly [ADP-ribose] polymerase
MLKCDIKSVSTTRADYKMIDEYIQNTSDHYKLKVVDMFEIEREGEKAIFNPLGLQNKKLLFHGSRFSNFPGIIGNGLRIAPPEAPSTGYNFGKGVYLADFAGKSTPYSCPHLSKNEILLIMCETALGNPRELTSPDYNAAKLPNGNHSTHALGRTRPNPSGNVMFEKNIEVPLGTKETFNGGGMGHNEFIVYNTN